MGAPWHSRSCPNHQYVFARPRDNYAYSHRTLQGHLPGYPEREAGSWPLISVVALRRVKKFVTSVLLLIIQQPDAQYALVWLVSLFFVVDKTGSFHLDKVLRAPTPWPRLTV